MEELLVIFLLVNMICIIVDIGFRLKRDNAYEEQRTNEVNFMVGVSKTLLSVEQRIENINDKLGVTDQFIMSNKGEGVRLKVYKNIQPGNTSGNDNTTTGISDTCED